MDDRRAALLLATLALAGAATRWLMAPPPGAPPGDVWLTAAPGPRPGLEATARAAARLARPLAPGSAWTSIGPM